MFDDSQGEGCGAKLSTMRLMDHESAEFHPPQKVFADMLTPFYFVCFKVMIIWLGWSTVFYCDCCTTSSVRFLKRFTLVDEKCTPGQHFGFTQCCMHIGAVQA